jgi:hypothetical protein
MTIIIHYPPVDQESEFTLCGAAIFGPMPKSFGHTPDCIAMLGGACIGLHIPVLKCATNPALVTCQHCKDIALKEFGIGEEE